MRLLFVDQNADFLSYLQHLFSRLSVCSTMPYIVHHDPTVIAHRLPVNSILVAPFFQFDASAIVSRNCVTSRMASGQTALHAPANPRHTFTTMQALFQRLASMSATTPLDFVLVPIMGGDATKAAARHIYAAFVDVFVPKKT